MLRQTVIKNLSEKLIHKKVGGLKMTSLIFSNFVGFFLVISLYILPFVIIIKIYYAFKKNEKRKDEMLEIEKQNTTLLQKRMDEMNNRLSDIEKNLKEVD